MNFSFTPSLSRTILGNCILLAISALALGVPSETKADRRETKVTLSKPLLTDSRKELGVVHLALPTRQGMERMVLRPRNPIVEGPVYENGESSARRWSDVALFTGSMRERGFRRGGKRRAVRADVIDGRLRVYFTGRRNDRRFAVRTEGVRSGAVARVSGVARAKKLPCGHPSHDHSFLAAAPVGGDVAARISGAPLAAEAVVPIFSPFRVLDIGIDADYELYQRFGSGALAEIQAILNAAEVYYQEQIGLRFKVVNSAIQTRPDNSLTATDADSLLNAYQLSVLGGPVDRSAADTFHLVSGKTSLTRTVSGGGTFEVLGIAGAPGFDSTGNPLPGPVCVDRANSFGLSKRTTDDLQAIVTAHELGHNLGASHPDTDFPNRTLPISLMDSVVEPTAPGFSDYSRGQIVGHINTYGNCLATDDTFLSFSAKVTGARFEGTFTPGAKIGSSCKSSLYAAKTKSALQVKLTGGVKLNQVAVKKSKKKVVIGTFKNKGRKKKIYVRAITTCTVGGKKVIQGSAIVSVAARDPDPIAALKNKVK